MADTVGMEARRAGQHAREMVRTLAARYLVYIALMLVVGGVALIAFGFVSLGFFLTELLVVAGLLTLERLGGREIDKWDRGATGEEEIGRRLDELGAGWVCLHDVATGRGNIDHVVIGPGGVFTVETKSHGGYIRVDRVDRRMLSQAYAQRKWVERVTGCKVEALLVFSSAYLDRVMTRRSGVLVVPGRILAKHLAGRKAVLAPDEVAAIHRGLQSALASRA